MLAITISCPGRHENAERYCFAWRWLPRSCTGYGLLCTLAFYALELPPTLAQAPSSEQEARRHFLQAQSAYAAAQTNLVAAWHFGRAAFNYADSVSDDKQRREIALAGIAACRETVRIDPQSAPAHYYMALNLGEEARSKRLGALRLLHEMEHELLAAREIDAALDYGGPDRALGLLYLDAPSWPLSVGNRNKARSHLNAAVQLSPGYPENHLALAEAYAQWGEVRNLERELNEMARLWPEAKSKFQGPVWAADWSDWEKRLELLRKTRSRLLANPRLSPAERGARPVR